MGFNGAQHVFDYRSGALHELSANPNHISMVLLEPGESVISVAAGENVRLVVDPDRGETERDGRTIVPQAAASDMPRLIVFTDEGAESSYGSMGGSCSTGAASTFRTQGPRGPR